MSQKYYTIRIRIAIAVAAPKDLGPVQYQKI